jgi:hypothetical protein
MADGGSDCYSDFVNKASQADRDYFARISRANRMLDDDRVPQSLDDMFDRLDCIRREHGRFAQPGILAEDEGDLEGHLRFLARIRSVLSRGTHRP